MTSRPSVLYTDEMPLHPNPVLGSLQLLWRLYNHPRAWRRALSQTTPDLETNFCLLELKPHHWQDPNVRRILVYAHLVWPVLASLISGVWLTATRQPQTDIIRGMLLSFSSCLGATVLMSLTHSVALGVGYGVVLGLGMGLPDSMGGVLYAVILAAGLGGQLAVFTAPERSARSMRGQIIGLSTGIVTILGVMLSGYLIMSGALTGSVQDGQIGGGIGWQHALEFGLGGGLVFGAGFATISRLRLPHTRTAIYLGITILTVFTLAYAGTLTIPKTNLIIHLFGGTGGSILFTGIFLLAYSLAERAGGLWVGAITGAFASGMAWLPLYDFLIFDPAYRNPLMEISNGQVVIAAIILAGLTLQSWMPLLAYPFHLLWNQVFYQRDRRNLPQPEAALRWNTVFWDEFQYLPLFGLDKHLVLVYEHNPVEGQAALHSVNASHQRWAAQAAQIELDARQLEDLQSVEAIAQAHQLLATGSMLVGPANVILHSFSQISRDAQVALNHTSDFHRRLGLKTGEDRLIGLLRDLTRSSERYAARFYPVASCWLEVLQARITELSQSVAASQEIENPYIVGVPLTEQQKIFVGRGDIASRLEHWLADQRCPPLFLYGQRRMGKTSLLLNLGHLLHGAILPLFVDGQYLAASNDFNSILAGMAREISRSARRQRGLFLPPITHTELAEHAFSSFNEWLDQLEQILDSHGYTSALLAIDELDALYLAAQRGRFEEADFLNLLRYLIQHRPRFKVLLTSARGPNEFGTWAGNLINLQVIQIGPLKPDEARQLIEHPMHDFALAYTPEASQRVMQLSGGHPFLLQLLCYEIVNFKNSQPLDGRRNATLADVETCIQPALRSGQFFFEEIQQQGIDDAGRNLLKQVALAGEGALDKLLEPGQTVPLQLAEQLQCILQRDLLEEVSFGVYRFRIELVRRWFLK